MNKSVTSVNNVQKQVELATLLPKKESENMTTNETIHKNAKAKHSTGTYVVELRSGDGGAEAYRFAQELANSFTRWLVSCNVTVQRIVHEGRGVIQLSVSGPATNMTPFIGAHRVQRQSGATKRHSSTVTVAVLGVQRETISELADSDLTIEFFRGQGPGGQHRNTTEQAVRITHEPSGIKIEIDGRSRANNIVAAKRELQRRLQVRQTTEQQRMHHQRRSDQIGIPQRSGKDFTHNWQRGEVVDHNNGKRWRLRDFEKGRLGRSRTSK